ncbi:MAG TPA: DinB family protein [Gemmatimonadales bacterium]|nr:DinB family protein [Gemmatimonadales bacterium]
MTEKDQLLNTMERELPKTLNVLRAFPPTKGELRPHERCRTAKDLAWTFVAEGVFADGALAGSIDLSQPTPPAPATMSEVITAYEQKQRSLMDRIRKTPDADLNKPMKVPTGPNQMADVRRMDLLWTTVMDTVHHRGQFSVYLRMAGGKVPSIYGPTADEPWN